MKKQLAWKVVYERDGIKRSCSFYLDDESRLRYKIGKWIKPRSGNGPIATFVNRESARKFIALEKFWSFPLKLYRVEIIPSRERCLWYTLCLFGTDEVTWKRDLEDCPIGTVLADRVKLLYGAR